MALHPVIMCGGSGTRLWPVSRPDRPKQFIPLVGDRSTFAETALRVAAIEGAAPPLVIAGLRHRAAIEAQLEAIGVKAALLLEPEGRESAAAIAAAAAWIAERDPEGLAVIVSADHHVPDRTAFAASIAATLAAASAGQIVTLGKRPTEPSTAYGYIKPAEGAGAVRPVAAFVEKPSEDVARRYISEGYLWNTGYFIAAVSTLLAELDAHAPAVIEAVRAALGKARRFGEVVELSPAFAGAPKTSIDYAVMEKTRRAAVLPVEFAWSDIGAWDAVWAASARDPHGDSLPPGSQAVGTEDVLVRAPPGVQVAVLGAKRLAVIVEPGAVLVANLEWSQAVKDVAAKAAPVSAAPRFSSVAEAKAWYHHWFRTAALPVWSTLGVDPVSGLFREGLRLDGAPHDPYRRARVQARQVFVLASAARMGFEGPWLASAQRGFEAYAQTFLRSDGLFASRCELAGSVSDATACVYEQAFSLLALCGLHRAGIEPDAMRDRAEALLSALHGHRHPAGGFCELDDHPFQSNAHMHLLEAALAWDEAGAGPLWTALADEIVALALAHFIDAERGFLREFFDEAWRPAAGDDGRWVEPGHQFEWAWLLQKWAKARGEPDAAEAARRLYDTGLKGVDRRREVAVGVLWDDLTVREGVARLWPQTEYLKASLVLGQEAEALTAAAGLARYLDVPTAGLFRDKLRPDGSFIDEASPASSLYHLAMAVFEWP